MMTSSEELDAFRSDAIADSHREIANLTHRYHQDVFQSHFQHKCKYSLSPVQFRPVNTIESVKNGLSLQYNLQSKIDSLDFVEDSREFVATNKELYRRLKCSYYSYFCSRNPEGIVSEFKCVAPRSFYPVLQRPKRWEFTPGTELVQRVHEEKNRCFTPKSVYHVVYTPQKRARSRQETQYYGLRPRCVLALQRNGDDVQMHNFTGQSVAHSNFP